MIINDIALTHKVYIACGFTDLRRSIDGLSILVQEKYHLDPFSPSIFLFCGRRSDRMKALLWEGDGFILLYKRLEDGKYQWPRNEEEVRELSSQELRWLFEGLKIEQPKALKSVSIQKVI